MAAAAAGDKIGLDTEGKLGPVQTQRRLLKFVAAAYGLQSKSGCVKNVRKPFIKQVCIEWVGSEVTKLADKKGGLLKAVQTFLWKATDVSYNQAQLDALFNVLNTTKKGAKLESRSNMPKPKAKAPTVTVVTSM